jgi:hypothetical protein
MCRFGFGEYSIPLLSLCVFAFLCDFAVNLGVKAVHRRDAEDAEVTRSCPMMRAIVNGAAGDVRIPECPPK